MKVGLYIKIIVHKKLGNVHPLHNKGYIIASYPHNNNNKKEQKKELSPLLMGSMRREFGELMGITDS